MSSRLQPLPNLVAQFNSPLQVGIELQGLIKRIEGILREIAFNFTAIAFLKSNRAIAGVMGLRTTITRVQLTEIGKMFVGFWG